MTWRGPSEREAAEKMMAAAQQARTVPGGQYAGLDACSDVREEPAPPQPKLELIAHEHFHRMLDMRHLVERLRRLEARLNIEPRKDPDPGTGQAGLSTAQRNPVGAMMLAAHNLGLMVHSELADIVAKLEAHA